MVRTPVVRTAFAWAPLGSTRRLVVRRLLPLCAAAVVAYAALPYVTLFRLGQAIRNGDAAALAKLVDWDGVREGLKEDICDEVLDDTPAPAASAGQPVQIAESGGHAPRSEAALPPFGSGFVQGIASNMIDENVTPDALAAAAHAQTVGHTPGAAAAPAAEEPQPRIVWAFFDGPQTFTVLLQPPGNDVGPIRIRMALRGGSWKVTRAWLPHELLVRANART